MNTSAKFECRWVRLETQKSPCAFTHGLKWRLYLPVAHAEGRFTAPSQILDQLESNRQVVFRYVSRYGGTPSYPENPNGSDLQIAGICDPTGRIFGMMPHPERFLARLNHPRWTRESLPEKGDGLGIFSECRSLCTAELFVGLRVDKIAHLKRFTHYVSRFTHHFPPSCERMASGTLIEEKSGNSNLTNFTATTCRSICNFRLWSRSSWFR